MGFDTLLGNQRLKDNLTASVGRGRIAHFYLICGPAGSGKKTLARLLAAAILCQEDRKPCLSCKVCRKVMADTHPDLITVTDPEHKNVAVKLVRQVREDMFIRPNEADRKIYVFPQELGIEGQNALLKVLEEPPSYGVFILLSDNPEKLLPTVRSRCVELRLQSLSEDMLCRHLKQAYPNATQEDIHAAVNRSGGYLGQAKLLLEDGTVSQQTEEFVRTFCGKDVMGLMQLVVPMERWKRDALLPELENWMQLLQQAICSRNGMPSASSQARLLGASRSPQELMQAVRHIQKALEYLRANVSPAAVCGYLEWALR